MLASHRSSNVAFEVQLGAQTRADTIARQRGYKASGVRGLWFFASRAYDVCEDIPSFQVRPAEERRKHTRSGYRPRTRLHEPGVNAIREEWTPLSEFVAGALGAGSAVRLSQGKAIST
ncbi:MAG: hypothetical protein QOC89_2062 [Paraburkholderia sp.]|nr:hypothetical protein [Paraburkholderia sp.]MEA3131997.1 hypothetical protein [Paraburkholderia sp.]